MMKKFIYLFFIGIMSVTFISCNDDDNEIDWEWKNANDGAYQEAAMDDSFDLLTEPVGVPKGVYRRVIEAGTGETHPFQTSKVKVNYKGYYYDGTLFDAGTSVTEIPVWFSISGTVRGFSTALQAMVVGDKWEIVIPYYLGYGSSIYNTIPGYTTLFFEVELLEIDLYPQ